ncbi:uncharacterized protein LOC115766058 isoform X12 [Drosophila novamexicana]|uniref:uncharacterized protein LOC115766058 isoform X12 n=1 Tax=Drosophila novamexicana TaxID=47314 RepID=UPI0011E59994|nr:uncharacterized protein LOC115766058 isoform X12 [Drosophila novamexicana]
MKINKNGRESLLLVPSPNHTLPVRTCSNASSLRFNMGHERDKSPDGSEEGLGYMHTLMYGRYTKDLGEFAKDEARKLKLLEKRRKQEDKQRNKCWEIFTGIAGQASDAYKAHLIMGLEAYTGTPGRGLGVPSPARHHNGPALLHHGQGHIDMYKCSHLALSRSYFTALHTVYCLGLIAGLFNIILSRLCASNRTTKYRFRYT